MRTYHIDPGRAVLPLLAILVMVSYAGRSLAADAASKQQTVGALIEKIIDAYGGKAVLKKVHSLSERAVLESPAIERPVSYTVDLREDRKLRVEKRAAAYLELRVLNGAQGYYQSTNSAPTSVSGAQLLAMVYQFKEIMMPFLLMNSSFAVSDGGKAEVKGEPARLLLLSDAEGPPIRLWVDVQSGRILKCAGVFSMGDAQTELASEFHDLRSVHGRLLPFRIVNYAGGQRIGEVRVKEYRVNPELPDSLFAPGRGPRS